LVQAHPSTLDYALDLGLGYYNLAKFVSENEKPEVALDWYAKAIDTLEAACAKDARLVQARQALCYAHWGRAAALSRMNRHSEALPDLERAIALDEGPNGVVLRLKLAISLLHAGEHVKAVAEVNTLAEGKDVKGDTLINAARICAWASKAVKDDTGLSQAERDERAEYYAARSVQLLGKAREGGYFRDPAWVGHLKKDLGLDPLRSRDDFKKFIQELEERSKTPLR
jgi:tetratricopeptide (TPR) repeat protein